MKVLFRVLMFGLGIWITACGGSSRPPAYREPPPKAPAGAAAPVKAPEKVPAPAAKPGANSEFGVEVLPVKELGSAGEDLHRFNRSGLPVGKTSGISRTFQEPLVLPKEGAEPLAFVLASGGMAFGKEVAQVFYRYQVRFRNGTQNKEIRETEVRAEDRPRRWVLPLAELFPKRANVDPEATFVLRLRIVFRDWSVKEGAIEFKAWGGPPKLVWSQLPGDRWTGMSLRPIVFVREALASGWPIENDVITNRLNRTARVWFRLSSAGRFQHSVTVETPRFREFPNPKSSRHFKAASPIDPRRESSEARFDLDGVTVEGNTYALVPGRWHSIDLPPGKKITLRWIARRSLDSPVIRLKQRRREIQWRNKAHEENTFCQKDSNLPGCQIMTQVLDETPEPIGSFIAGVLDREIRVADPGLEEKWATHEQLDALDSDRVQILIRGVRDVRRSQGLDQHARTEVVWRGVPTL